MNAPPARAVASRRLGVQTVVRKVGRAWTDRTLTTKLIRYARNWVVVPTHAVIAHRRLPAQDRRIDLDAGFADHRQGSHYSTCSEAGLYRIVKAYRHAEDSAASAPADFSVRGVWSEWLDLHYGILRRHLRDAEVDALRRLFDNLHRESMSTGVGGTRDDMRFAGGLGRRYHRVLWCAYRDVLEQSWPDWERFVFSPMAGNPSGPWVGDKLVTADTLRYAFYAKRLLERIANNGRSLRILEIGGGLGGQALQFLQLGRSRVQEYTLVDIPEVASLSAFCLMASVGEQNVRVFGESPNSSPVNIVPPWVITDLPPERYDLVFNSYSFAEMDGRASARYLSEVERLRSRWFFHINHDRRFVYRQPDGASSINRLGSELVPDPSSFELVERRMAPFVRPENRANPGFEYLYRRRNFDVSRPSGIGI